MTPDKHSSNKLIR